MKGSRVRIRVRVAGIWKLLRTFSTSRPMSAGPGCDLRDQFADGHHRSFAVSGAEEGRKALQGSDGFEAENHSQGSDGQRRPCQ